ncbi:phosphate ABC transporter substrate-binding protein PstS [Kutzneria viridogrisea]|nr:phosphate transport system substrate-binding protein [Kutzneria viridogrisea]
MKRHGAALGIVAAGALLLTACGSDNNTQSGGSTGGSTTTAAGAKPDCGGKKSLKSSGSTAQANAMSRFVSKYNAECDGYNLDYTGNGSGAGINEFLAKQTDFAGSDSALSASKGEVDKAKTRCDGNPAWNLPTVFGPIAITYNIPGVSELALDGPTLAKIFSGQITNWNDAAIKKLNPSASLPDLKIAVVYRSDESGTTDNFQQYLTAAGGGAWTKGAGKVFAGGVGSGGSKNDGVATILKQTSGGIAYVEWSFALNSKLATASIATTEGGTPVKVSAETVGKAIDAAKFKNESGNDLALDLSSIHGSKVAGAYPIVLATYEVVCSKYSDADTGKAVKAFLTVAINDGQTGLDANGYVPLPSKLKDKLSAAVKAIS